MTIAANEFYTAITTRLCLALVALCVGTVARAQEISVVPIPNETLCRSLTCETLEASLVGTYRLNSTHEEFGGFSGLEVSPDGRVFYAVTDQGHLWTGALEWADDTTLKAIDSVVVRRTSAELPQTKHEVDAESIRSLPGADGLLISFEHNHRLEQHSLIDRVDVLELPENIINMLPGNGGIEAFVPMDGGYLLFTEDVQLGYDQLAAWFWRPGAQPIPLIYPQTDDFSPSDAVLVNNHTILLLEREYSWMRMRLKTRLMRLNIGELSPGTRLEPHEIAYFDDYLDNTEGLASFTRGGGRYVVTISDDNFLPIQDTVLSVWRLKE